MDWKLLLSHHYPDESDRCFELKGLRLCSRCSGLYPALLLTVILLSIFPSPSGLLDAIILFGLPAPAILDWGAGLLGQWKGSNLTRFVSGLLLGVSIGRVLFLNVEHPLSAKVMLWFAEVGILSISAFLLKVAANKLRRE